MKKLIALILASVMLFASAALAAPEKAEKAEAVRLEGYVAGNRDGAVINEWIGFYDTDPTEFTVYDFQVDTYAAAYRKGYVYGYIYGYNTEGVLLDYFYRMACSDHSVEYIDGASSSGEFVYGMAYDPTSDTIFALCDENNPYIASVDIATGALTRVVTVDLGNYLGIYTFAIDGSGNFYALTFSATNSRLVRINKQTGALTQLMSTGYDCYYAQSMTYDTVNDRIYWAHADYSANYKNGLYVIDMSDYSLSYLGVIGTDMEITCLYINPNETVEPEEFTVTFVDWDGAVLSQQTVPYGGAAEAPAAPVREGYTFIGWDADFSNVTGDLTVTAVYEENPAPAGLLGDVNCDGEVTMADVSALIAYLMNSGSISDEGYLNADANADGTVDILDATAIYAIAFGA